MALMTLCDHVIVTAGTFGWWGAWLSGGITVYYKGYPGHNLSNRFNLFDYYPSHWIGL
jgi:galactoside 2-L-fucosyltransferase 1/2